LNLFNGQLKYDKQPKQANLSLRKADTYCMN